MRKLIRCSIAVMLLVLLAGCPSKKVDIPDNTVAFDPAVDGNTKVVGGPGERAGKKKQPKVQEGQP